MPRLTRRAAIAFSAPALFSESLLSACVGAGGQPSPSPAARDASAIAPSAAEAQAPTATRATPSPTTARPTETPPAARPSATATAVPAQAPALQTATAAGELPPLRERLPNTPLVPAVNFDPGRHGGSLVVPLRSAVDTTTLESWFGHEPLLRWDPTWRELVPNLAESWAASPDARSFTFRFRVGVRWSDGKPFTSADVRFWYDDILANDEVTPVKPDWMLAGGKLGRLDAPDDRTVRFTFDVSNGLFPRRLAALGASQFWPQADFARQYHIRHNREQVERLTREQAQPSWADVFNRVVNQTPELGEARWYRVGTPTLAPWIVTSSLSEGPRLSARRNPYYWKVDRNGSQLPYLDEVSAVVANGSSALASLLERGHLDVVLDTATESIAIGGPAYQVVSVSPESPNTCVLAPNLNAPDRDIRALFQSLDFRIGLSLALDRTEMARRVPGLAGEPWQVAPRPDSPFFDRDFATAYTEHDAAGAQAAFTRAGLRRASDGRLISQTGSPVAFTLEPPAQSSALVEAARLIAANWNQLGLQVSVQPMDRAARASRFRDAQFGVAMSAGEGGIDPALNPTWYLPHSSAMSFAPLWALWAETGGARGLEPPPPAREQQRLYREIQATADLATQRRHMADILSIARQQLWVIGLTLPPAGRGLVSAALGNFPKSLVVPTREHVVPGSHAPEVFFAVR